MVERLQSLWMETRVCCVWELHLTQYNSLRLVEKLTGHDSRRIFCLIDKELSSDMVKLCSRKTILETLLYVFIHEGIMYSWGEELVDTDLNYVRCTSSRDVEGNWASVGIPRQIVWICHNPVNYHPVPSILYRCSLKIHNENLKAKCLYEEMTNIDLIKWNYFKNSNGESISTLWYK